MKKKILALCLVIALAVTAVTGVTLAYFTDTQEATNTFTLGNVEIKLDEAEVLDREPGTDVWETTEERVTGNDYGPVFPGAVLPKDPTVHNTGSNRAYIRATVNVSNWMNICSELGLDEEDITVLVDDLGEGWSVVETVAGDTFTLGQFDTKYVLKYAPILEADADTTPIFTNVNVPAGFESGAEYLFEEIKIEAHAIQADGFDNWEEAFAAFDAQ